MMKATVPMNKHTAKLLNNKGVTLIELVVAMMVLSIIMISVTAVFAPILRSFERANNLAEANTLLDNLSALIMDDVGSATAIPLQGSTASGGFAVKTAYDVFYYGDADGILWRKVPGFAGPVLQKDFYKYRGDDTVFSVAADCDFDEASGLVTITLTLSADFGWTLERVYTAKPVGLAS